MTTEPVTSTPQSTDRPNGAGAAAILAAGIGCFAVGLLTTIAEMSASIKDTLDLYSPVGPLSGKTVFAAVVWALAWGILHPLFKSKDVAWSKITTVTWLLVAGGALLTFPTFFQLFAAE